MGEIFDVIVVGGGHNALAAAAYLARDGKRVLVLERRDGVGGIATTAEFAPGFRSSVCQASVDRLHPRVVRDLELERHGLRTVVGGDTVLLRDAGGPLRVRARGPEAAAAADGIRELQRLHRRIAGALEAAFAEPLPDPELRGIGDIIDLLTLGWRLRRLGRDDMPEALRLLPMPLRDVLQERVDDPGLQALVALPALGTTWLGPFSAGGYLALLMRRPAWADDLLGPPTWPIGGTGAVSDALAAAARNHGAEIRTDAEVSSIDVDGNRVVGVSSGAETIPARAVVSGLDPRRTLLELGDPTALAPEDARAVANIRARGSAAFIHLALESLPRFDGVEADAGALSGRLQIGDTPAAIERAFDPIKYGRLPEEPALEITLPSLADPALAPEGRHVMHVRVDYVPHRLADGDWNSAADTLADTVVARIAERAPGFADLIVDRAVVTPADIESALGITGGCLHHVEPALDSMAYMRPVPGGWGHATPVRGLYLCGPGTHPGGGITAIPGRLAALQVSADWRELAATSD